MPFGGLLSVGVGIAGKAVLGAIQQHKANQIKPDYHPYTPSPYAQQTYGLAQQVYNGRMAGASSLERNILANQSNQQANVARTATDGSQALAVQAGQQGQTNQAFSNLQTQEANNKYQMLNNLNLASAGMTAEGDKQYQSQLQKYQMDASQQSQLRQAGLANMFGALGDVGKAGMMAAHGDFDKNSPNYGGGGGYQQLTPQQQYQMQQGGMYGGLN